MLTQPLGHLGDFLAEARDRLRVHVRLGDELGEGNCEIPLAGLCFFSFLLLSCLVFSVQ